MHSAKTFFFFFSAYGKSKEVLRSHADLIVAFRPSKVMPPDKHNQFTLIVLFAHNGDYDS
jgi:hypothetical protein